MKIARNFFMPIAATAAMPTAAVAQDQVTFTKGVPPILQEHCPTCPHVSTDAPMSFVT